jgi:hypothetical protein
MNVWKPIALVLAAGLVVSVGAQTASAQANAANCHNQPNMMAALGGFKTARAALERAEHNKGGWRERAKVAADNAIKETETGCAFADTH